MSRLHVPGLVDVLRVDDPAQVAALADDRRLDRDYQTRGPLLNGIIAGRIRKDLQLDGSPLPPVAPRGPSRPLPAQAALEEKLVALAAPADAETLAALAAYVRGAGASDGAGPLAQTAVGQLFDPGYRGDGPSWAAAKVFDAAPRSFNPFKVIWWSITDAVPRARQLLADKVRGDPSGLHGTGVAVHNIVAGFQRMRALWADPAQRRALSAEAAAAQCLVAPDQVVRQPVVAGGSVSGDFEATTLVLLQLQAAHTADPEAEMAFMTQSWSRCPAHGWVPALLAAVWRTAQERPDGV